MRSTTFQTSSEAYAHCVKNGIISDRVALVFKAVCDASGPINQTMAHQTVIRETGKVGIEKYSISPRFAVLERMGLIRVSGKGPCPVTKRTTAFYEPTFERERMTETEAISKAQRRETEAQLREENRRLKDENTKLCELLDRKTGAFQQREEAIRRSPKSVQTEFFAV